MRDSKAEAELASAASLTTAAEGSAASNLSSKLSVVNLISYRQANARDL